MGLREQAALWSRVSVVVQIHGAAITNWVFLPRNAVVVHIVPRPRPYDEHDTLFAHYLVGRGLGSCCVCAANSLRQLYAGVK